MAIHIRGYFSTGFTATNPPDSEATLEKAGIPHDFPDLAILTPQFLDGEDIIIKATKQEITGMDYVKIWDDEYYSWNAWFYYVNGYKPVNKNAQALSLTAIYLLVAGGVSNVDFITGFLQRKSPDANPLSTQGFFSDEYMQPALPLKVKYQTLTSGAAGTEPSFTHFTATKIDLGAQAAYNGEIVPIDETVTDAGGESTTVSTKQTGGALAYRTITNPAVTNLGIPTSKYAAQYALYTGDTDYIVTAENNLRAIGAESGIISSYLVPSYFVDKMTLASRFVTIGEGKDEQGRACSGLYYGNGSTASTDGDFIPYARHLPNFRSISNYISSVKSKLVQWTPTDSKIGTGNYGTVVNQCLYFGDGNRMGIVTDGNNRFEANPERLVDFSKSDSAIVAYAPKVSAYGDLRYDGKPYYCFSYIDGNSIGSPETQEGTPFFVYAVTGNQWMNCPIVWTDVSGGKLLESQYKNQVSMQALSFAQSRQGFWNRLSNRIGEKLTPGNSDYASTLGTGISTMGASFGALAGMGGKAVAGGLAAGAGGAALATVGAAGLAAGAGVVGASLLNYRKIQNAASTYALEQAQELGSYMSSVNVVVPEISFQPQCDLFRLATGASAIFYRYEYDPKDVKRIDTILTAFGWKTCVVPKRSDLTAHKAFDYLQGDVQVKAVSNLAFPKWLSDGISAELSAGVRIWHQKPVTITADCNPHN